GVWAFAQAVTRAGTLPPKKKGEGTPPPPPIQPKPEELAKIREKSEQIESLVKELRAKRADAVMIGDVEVFAHAGRMLLEYPELIGTQAALDRAYPLLDRGIERAQQWQAGKPEWNTGKKQIHAYYSEIDGSVQPYGITLPENYDPSKPARLYVWLHGRQNNATEAEFIHNFLTPRQPG